MLFRSISVDVRIVAATNKDLLSEIEKGNFREDLYHRLSVILIHVPPLKERRSDIPDLFKHFLKQICEEQGLTVPTITPAAMEEMQKLEWTGNVRELHNVVERLVILCGTKITEQDISDYAVPARRAKTGAAANTNMYERYEKFQDF